MKYTNTLQKAIVPFEQFHAIQQGASWGDAQEKDFYYTDGATATKIIKFIGVKCPDKLLDQCGYVFCWNKAHSHLCATRVTYHPSTVANIMKGSRKYGSLHIWNEV